MGIIKIFKMAVKGGKTSTEKRAAVAISKKAMNVMNSFVNDLFERVALEASKLARYRGKQTLSSNDVQSAVKLILPGDLAEHAVAEGTRALNKFGSSSA